MHAVLVKVRIKSGRHDDALQGLQSDVVPRAKEAPGLVKGTWFGNKETGHGLLVFESEEQAQQVAGMITAGDDDPVEIEDVHVYEVNAQT